MIYYRNDGPHFFLKILSLRGSAYAQALVAAVPCAVLTGTLYHLVDRRVVPDVGAVLNNVVWSSFSVLVGFLVIFRTSQAYARFWEGCAHTHEMMARWFDACSSLVAFCKHSDETLAQRVAFQGTLIRLFSILHAVAWARIEENAPRETAEAYHFELLDAQGIDERSLAYLQEETMKVELTFQWIQNVVVENMRKGVLDVPAPILSRSFDELANGMAAFHQAMKITEVPFPFPYAQMCDCLLMIHWCVVPFVVYPWTTSALWAGVLSFVQVFILWSLNLTAIEIEDPFGLDPNDLDGCATHDTFNKQLQLLVRPHAQDRPTITPAAIDFHDWEEAQSDANRTTSTKSSVDVWQNVNLDGHISLRTRRQKARNSSFGVSSLPSLRGVWARWNDDSRPEDPEGRMSARGSIFSVLSIASRPSSLASGAVASTALERRRTHAGQPQTARSETEEEAPPSPEEGGDRPGSRRQAIDPPGLHLVECSESRLRSATATNPVNNH